MGLICKYIGIIELKMLFERSLLDNGISGKGNHSKMNEHNALYPTDKFRLSIYTLYTVYNKVFASHWENPYCTTFFPN